MEAGPKENKTKKIKLDNIIIAVIAILIFAGFGVYYYFNVYNKNEDKNPNKETTTTKPKEEKKVQIVDLQSKSRPYAVMINKFQIELIFPAAMLWIVASKLVPADDKIPTKINNDNPFPIPCSVIFSPSQTVNIAPATNTDTTIIPVNH